MSKLAPQFHLIESEVTKTDCRSSLGAMCPHSEAQKHKEAWTQSPKRIRLDAHLRHGNHD